MKLTIALILSVAMVTFAMPMMPQDYMDNMMAPSMEPHMSIMPYPTAEPIMMASMEPMEPVETAEAEPVEPVEPEGNEEEEEEDDD